LINPANITAYDARARRSVWPSLVLVCQSCVNPQRYAATETHADTCVQSTGEPVPRDVPDDRFVFSRKCHG